MVTDDGARKINEAIKACLRECYDAELPLAALAAFLAKLRTLPDWNAADVDLVELGVHRMLKLMVRRSREGDFEPVVPLGKRSPEAKVQQKVVDLMNDVPPAPTNNPPRKASTTPDRTWRERTAKPQ